MNPTSSRIIRVKTLGRTVLLLPAFAFVLALASSWILGAEYQRVRAVRSKLNELIPSDLVVSFPSGTWYEKLFAYPIGHVTTLIFLLGFSLLAAADAVALWIVTAP